MCVCVCVHLLVQINNEGQHNLRTRLEIDVTNNIKYQKISGG